MICTLKCAFWQAGEQLGCQGPGSLGGHSLQQCVLPARKANNFLGCVSSSSSTDQGKWWTASAMHMLDHIYRAVSRFGLPGKMMSEFSTGSSGWLGAARPGRRGWGSWACSAGEAGTWGAPLQQPVYTFRRLWERAWLFTMLLAGRTMGISWNKRSSDWT